MAAHDLSKVLVGVRGSYPAFGYFIQTICWCDEPRQESRRRKNDHNDWGLRHERSGYT